MGLTKAQLLVKLSEVPDDAEITFDCMPIKHVGYVQITKQETKTLPLGQSSFSQFRHLNNNEVHNCNRVVLF